jgi:hypothetical protein
MKQQKRITVYINNLPVERWYGATVEHAVIAYNQRILNDIRELRAWVVDARGLRVGLGGTLQDDARLYIRYAKKPSSSDARKM